MAFVALAAAPLGKAGGKAGEMGMVTFHLERDGGDRDPKRVFTQMDDGKERVFGRSPEISMKDIVSFRPFPSGDGDQFGVVFMLNDAAKRRLNAISIAHQGKYLLAQANGRVVDGVVIDKPVNDGMIVIWKGLVTQDVNLFDKALPRFGDDGKPVKKKK